MVRTDKKLTVMRTGDVGSNNWSYTIRRTHPDHTTFETELIEGHYVLFHNSCRYDHLAYSPHSEYQKHKHSSRVIGVMDKDKAREVDERLRDLISKEAETLSSISSIKVSNPFKR